MSVIGAYIWLVWSTGLWRDGRQETYYGGSMQLSFIPLHVVGSILMTVASAFISCVCCCVGKGAVDFYGRSALCTAVLAFCRFCGACGFIRGLLFGDEEAECEMVQFREYERDYDYYDDYDDVPVDCCDGCACEPAPDIRPRYHEPYTDCGQSPFPDDDDPGRYAFLLFVLLPWATWCAALLAFRACGSECFAKKWSAPVTQQPAVMPVSAVAIAQTVQAGP